MHIERIEPYTKEWNLYFANHIIRYKFATQFFESVSEKHILDIASGIGYGTNYLASLGFASVTGVDISNETIQRAKKLFKAANINYIQDNCNNLQTANQKKYNGIVSFETLEHLKEQDYFCKEIYNMLLANGFTIISTPNIRVTGHHSKDDWQYHEKELTPTEFYEMLQKAGFRKIQLYGQQFTNIGRLRNDIRHEFNIIRSNPFVRLGRWLQELTKNHTFEYPLPEREEDFEIKPYSVEEMEQQKKQGPFVIIAVCYKK